jgi:hypothetical protein
MNGKLNKALVVMLVILLCGVGLASAGFVFGGMKSVEFTRNGPRIYSENVSFVTVDEIYREFTDIEIDVDIMDRITLREGENYSIKGQNLERNGGLSAELHGGTLVVRNETNRFFGMGINLEEVVRPQNCEVVITYPAGAPINKVKANIDVAGIFEIDGLVASEAAIESDTGMIQFYDVKCGKLFAKTQVGSCFMQNIEAGDAEFRNQTGKWEIIGLTTGALKVNTDIGDFTITGAVLEGESLVKNNIGSLQIDLDMSKDDLNYSIDTDIGSIRVDGRDRGRNCGNKAGDSNNNLRIRSQIGSVEVNFEE